MKDIDPDKLLAQSNEQYKAMFDFYKANPALAAIDLLNQDLPPYQRIIVNGNLTHSFCLNILSRGMGKTRVIAMIAALEGMFNKNKKIGLLGPKFGTSKLAFMELQAIANESPILQASIKKMSQQSDRWMCEFHNGATIIATPLAADSKISIRGIRLHTVMLDEYPHVPKETLDAVITPMTATSLNPMVEVRRIERQKQLLKTGKISKEDIVIGEKNKILGFSSAYFKYNHMYTTMNSYKEMAAEQKVKTGKSDYAVYVFNYLDAPEGFIKQEVIEHARKTAPEIIFRMEYLSEFPEDSDGFYKRSVIDGCTSKDPNSFFLEDRAAKEGIYFLAADPARNHDAFALAIMKLVGTEIRLVRIISYNNTPFPIIAQEIRKLIKQYNIHLMGMDAGGGGTTMKDLLADPVTAVDKDDIILDIEDEGTIGQTGKRMLRLFDFSPNWITQANYEMRSSMEHRRLMFPNLNYGDTFIKPDFDPTDTQDYMLSEYFSAILELQSIIVTMTKSGVLHFDTEKQSMRKDRYSAMLICHKLITDFIREGFRVKELATGGWLSKNGQLLIAEDEHENGEEWKMTGIIDRIAEAKKGKINKFDEAALEK